MENDDDRKRRIMWFKANKQYLGNVCRTLISIALDATERESARAREADLAKIFGVPLRTATSSDETLQRARQHIAPDGMPSE